MIHADHHNGSLEEPEIIFTDTLRARMAWESEVSGSETNDQPHKDKSACPV